MSQLATAGRIVHGLARLAVMLFLALVALVLVWALLPERDPGPDCESVAACENYEPPDDYGVP
jgi:hypothetical protein